MNKNYIGIRLEAIRANLAEDNILYRVSKIDGKPMVLTRDYHPRRLNFELQDGIIVVVTKG